MRDDHPQYKQLFVYTGKETIINNKTINMKIMNTLYDIREINK